MEFSRFLDKFPEVREDSGGYLVPCPAHDDGRPSLFLTLKEDGRLLVYCRAGCEQDAVLRALSMTVHDLFGWTAGGAAVVKGGTEVAAAGPGEVAALRVWLDRAVAEWSMWDPGTQSTDTLLLIEEGEAYIIDRFGLDVATAERLGVGLSPAGSTDAFDYLSPRFRRFPRLVVPLVGFDGVTRGAQGRDLSGKCEARWVSLSNLPRPPRERAAPAPITWAKYGVFQGDGGYDAVIVTEGPSDALTAVGVGYTAVAVRGASLAQNPALADELAAGLRGHHVLIAGDRDKAGEKYVRTLGDALIERGLAPSQLVIPREGEDLTAWRERIPGIFPDCLHEAVRAARPIAPPREAERALEGKVMDRATGTDTVTADDGEEAATFVRRAQERYGKSDVARAHALVEFVDGSIKYASGLGFYVWTGRYWEQSQTRVRQAIHRMCAALHLAGKTDEAQGFGSRKGIDNLMEELRAVPAVAVQASAFDARPELLSFRNGTVDLRAGGFRAHDPGDMLTRYIDRDYVPTATAPRWESFLREIFPTNPELTDYVRRLVGYGITGDTGEQAFAVLWGKGANGKSVLTDTLTDVFREISTTTPFATFEEKQSGGIPNDLAALRGARLVMASEGESGKPMAEAVLKRVTGADMISARFLRKEFFEFKPAFLLMLATNHKPRFKGQDDGLWRRVKLIQFARFFAPHERDHTLTSTLRNESAGIIAWAVRGAQEWYADGLQDPDVIREATREYRETSDPLAGFLGDVLVISQDDTHSVLLGDAFNAYLEWCEAENLNTRERWTKRKFAAAMEERGAVRHRLAKGMALIGVRDVEEIQANTSEAGRGNSPERPGRATEGETNEAVKRRIFE